MFTHTDKGAGKVKWEKIKTILFPWPLIKHVLRNRYIFSVRQCLCGCEYLYECAHAYELLQLCLYYVLDHGHNLFSFYLTYPVPLRMPLIQVVNVHLSLHVICRLSQSKFTGTRCQKSEATTRFPTFVLVGFFYCYKNEHILSQEIFLYYIVFFFFFFFFLIQCHLSPSVI